MSINKVDNTPRLWVKAIDLVENKVVHIVHQKTRHVVCLTKFFGCGSVAMPFSGRF
jgi:hypothetical protein